MSTIDRIRKTQARLAEKYKGQMDLDAPPPHRPELLLIGCVDARLDIIGDLGIPRGKALVFRNIAAMVQSKDCTSDLSNMSELAALEFAINVMRVKDVVVLGHTDCGGIRASLEAAVDQHKAIHQYLQPLDPVRKEIIAQGGDIEEQARAMEIAAVQRSVRNLKSYYVVQDAIAEKRLTLHGWVINTATGAILELEED